jgi:predicted RNA-binding Zn-ribbon protein involved in translation (DUF1610 family)
MNKTIARMLLKACPKCHGDLILDTEDVREMGQPVYNCLQCGRIVRIEATAERELVKPMAA